MHEKPYADVKDRLAKMGIDGEQAEAFWLVIRANLETLEDAQKWWEITQHGASAIDPEDKDYIQTAMELLPAKPWNKETWGEWTSKLKAETGRKGKGLFMPLRKALTGESHGPDMADFMPLLQKP
jgi:glutamyl-tRNA synthetase